MFVLAVEAVDQLMAAIGQGQGVARQRCRQFVQWLLELQAQLFFAQALHQHVFVFHQDDLALADHADAVGHFFGFFDVVGGQDDGHAALAQAADHGPHVAAQLDVDAGGGLVEKQNRGFVGQRLGDHHPALHAAGQLKNLRVLLVPQRQVLEQLFEVGRVRLFAEQAATELQRGPNGFKHVVDQLLRHQADLRAGGAVILDDVIAADLHRAAAGVDDAADDADQGGLARAVGAEQGEDFTRLDVQIDAAQGGVAGGVGLVQLLDGNDRLHEKSSGGQGGARLLGARARRLAGVLALAA